MPTISFSYKDFQKLLGKKLAINDFKDLAILYAKAEVESYANDEIKLALDDTNTPHMWSVEGLARFFRGVLGIEKGLPKLKVHDSDYKIIVESSVKKIRPFIATFVAVGPPIDNYFLEQLIQLQEKFCESYGRKREKVSIGLYSQSKIKFPVQYKAVSPHSVKFVPLEMNRKLSLSEVLEKHPKGKQYGWIIKKYGKYPLLVDSNKEILSLVPIINSSFIGQLKTGDKEMLFEATGTDSDAVNLAANIFAQNLHERGFKILSITITDNHKSFKTPHSFNEKIKLNSKDVENLTGLKLSPASTKSLLEKARYGFANNKVTIPNYRRDILHVSDVIEDIAIMYGFDKIESAPLQSYTIGYPTKMNVFVDSMRELAIGLGFQEILSPILSNNANLQQKMESSTPVIEIENIMSETYSAVRNWLTPVMLEVLSKNKHNDYPQKIFEQGIASSIEHGKIRDKELLVLAISHTKADFTEVKQVADAIFHSAGLKYEIEPSAMKTFIIGRGGTLKVSGKTLGIIGEVSLKVLSNWNLEMPTAILEIDLTQLKELIK